MKIIVGLGNPGPQYELTRHNVGFLAVDRIVDRWRAQGPVTHSQADLYKTDFRGERVLLAKPTTFMNRSGISIAMLCSFFKIKPQDLIVIHDDLDLPALSLRIKSGGGDGGHNGLKSIDQSMGASGRGYHRIRIGIGRPQPKVPGAPAPSSADYVLAPMHQEDLTSLDTLLDQVTEAVELCVQDQVKEAMNRFNRRDPKAETKTEEET